MGNTISDRIRMLRTTLNLSQTKFGAPIGLGRGEVGNIEYGITEPKEITIPIICREYGVSEKWLREGVGDMFVPQTRGEIYGQIVADAAKVDPEQAKRFFKNFIDDFGEEELVMMYLAWRKQFPQFDIEKED